MIQKFFKLILIGLITYSCCDESDENYGVIQSDLEIDGFYIVTYDCLSLPDTACIRDDVQYKEIFKITGTDSDCKDIQLPEVDFTKHSILINYRYDSGKLYYHRTVTVDSTSKIVTYIVSTASCPRFTDYVTESYNLVLVPKIGNEFKIEYK